VNEEFEHLQRAVNRLMEAQREALDVTERALDAEAESLGDDERPGAGGRFEAALVDVRDILEGALDDTRDILEGGA
jgi:hypothetical protein